MQFNGLSFILAYALGTLAFFSLTRGILALFHWDRLAATDTPYGFSFLYGLRIDSMTVSILFIVPVLIWCLGIEWKAVVSQFLKIYFFLMTLVVVFLEIATVPFFEEYDCRPNELFIDYLRYPREVFSTIWSANRVSLIFSIIVLSSLIFAFWKIFPKFKIYIPRHTFLVRGRNVFLGLLVLFLGIRSSFGHRPANLSDAAFSNSHLVNEITKNSLYSLGFTVYSRNKYSTDIGLYGEMDPQEAVRRVRARLSIQGEPGYIPFQRLEPTHFAQTKSKNLVVILEESLGAQFVEAFGGEPGLTPQLNSLANQGLSFKNLYATGTRSVRGMEAIAAGFLPVPGESVVKRNKAQRNFFTVASLLKPLGYETSFIYGGEARFDNMSRWYRGNGFDHVIDQGDFKSPIFRGVWGVCDEDLFLKAHDYFQEKHAAGQAFFSLVFTTSFHSPFEFPPGRVAASIDGSKLKGAVAYADYALGMFFEKARAADYYKDTVFLVIADHDVRVFGSELVPIKHFKIPGVILGEHVQIEAVTNLVSQPDVIATALDFIGVPLTHPILGRSVFIARNNFAFMQYHDTYALMTPAEVAIIHPGKNPQTFRREGHDLEIGQPNQELEKDLLAFIHTASYLYENRLHAMSKKALSSKETPK